MGLASIQALGCSSVAMAKKNQFAAFLPTSQQLLVPPRDPELARVTRTKPGAAHLALL